MLTILLLGCHDKKADGAAEMERHSERDRIDGVYVTADEISGFSGTILELKDGAFRYWFYSDVGGGDEYPISGKYKIQESNLVLMRKEATDEEALRKKEEA